MLASQLNDNIKKLNIADEDKSVLLGTIARLIQLTSSISSQAPPVYECLVNIWGDDSKMYQKLVTLPYAPNMSTALIDFGTFIMNPSNIESIIYDVETRRFIIQKKRDKKRKVELLTTAGFEEV